MTLTELLQYTIKRQASDLHLSAGLPPIIRIDGRIAQLDTPALSGNDIHSMLAEIMSSEQRTTFERDQDIDLAYEIAGLSRFRVNAFQQARGPAAAFRVIPSRIMSLDEIDAPTALYSLINRTNGLILVTGPTGCGKSTTLAAMIDLLNQQSSGHLITIEDPIEYIHTSKRCVINQREIGTHTHSFGAALRASLREDPDTIMIGEMRDPETMRLALTAAETGHLVFSTLHTSSSAKTIDRIIDSFPSDEKPMVRAMLAESLQAVIAQVLIPKLGGGRIAAHEILLCNGAVRNLIRENKTPQIYSSMQTHLGIGMQTMDHALTKLLRQGVVAPESVASYLVDPGKVEQ